MVGHLRQTTKVSELALIWNHLIQNCGMMENTIEKNLDETGRWPNKIHI